MRPIPPALFAAVALILAAPAGTSVSAGGTVTLTLRVSGAITSTSTWRHAGDAKDTLPAGWACKRFTKPNFPVKGRPLAYNLNFANRNLLTRKPGLFFAFYYDPAKLGKPQVLFRGQGGANILVVPKANRTYGLGSVPSEVKITVTLARDYLSGSFVAEGLQGVLPTSGKVTVRGSWTCTGLFVRPT